MTAEARPWRAVEDGLRIAVRATPRASKSALLPGTAEYFAARIAAPPVEGAANAALIELVAKAFGVPRRDVSLIAGDTARVKRIAIAGDPKTLAGIAASLYGAGHER
ncbi:DUF167 domain-containing protein [Sphingomonas sp. ST-64]|uniref:UPF0235 protein ABS767_01690 n=1 Tax=Sphingomonas plantiphila TaxID=3163295 RepID=A0ABW8YJM8_9SPHN